MNHKTNWNEIQTLFWVCDGCFKRCQVCRYKPDDGLDCDSSDKMINGFLHKEVANENGQTS